MNTQRIEEMVEKIINQIPRYCLTNNTGLDALKEDRQGAFGDITELDLVLGKALTEAHQAGYADGYKQGKFDAEVTAEYGEPQGALQDNK